MDELFEDEGPRDPAGNVPEYTVAEISGAVKRALEDEFGRIRVRGEVGRVFKARSGHLYYDIKDDRNVLACTTWKGQIAGLSVVPEEGLEVVVTGRLSAFGAQSKYNMNVEDVVVAGQGALMALLERRKKALEAEGLFDPARKRPLPYLPEVIGVITSPQGAVIRDILHRLRDRFPRKVLIWPVAVQGAACAPQVAKAIEGFSAMRAGGPLPRPDLLIVARGGGSLEDLWGFNEEIVARAAAASQIPLISAVGHETDTTLIDYVSDRRAPTPSAAAEMAVPVRLELMAWLREAEGRLGRSVANGMGRRRQRLRDLARGLPAADRLLESPRQRLDRADRLDRALLSLIGRRRAALSEAGGGLSLNMLLTALRQKRQALDRTSLRLTPALLGGVRRKRDRLEARATRLRPEPMLRSIAQNRHALHRAQDKLSADAADRFQRLAERLQALDRLRQTLGYEATLKRGYAVVRGDGAVVTRKKAAQKAVELEIQFADGRLKVAGKPRAPVRKPKTPPPDQGSLF